MDSDHLDAERREVLRQAALLLAGLGTGALAACTKPERPAAKDTGPAPDAAAPAPPAIERALLPAQRAIFEAACARILPSDHEPGAREANVVEYLDRELARREYSAVKKAMLAGLVALDRFANRLGARPFVALAPEEQDEILRKVQTTSDRGRDFVKFLVAFTLEGFAGDPIYGGNKGGAGWKLVGYGPGNPDGSGKGGHGHAGH